MEEGGERWSKPHVATLSLHSLFELRCALLQGSVLLDMDAANLDQVVGESYQQAPVGLTDSVHICGLWLFYEQK